MKKIILIFVTFLFAVSVKGQLVGDGLTPGTAYCGTITTSQSWTNAYNSGIIYVGQTGNPDLTIGAGGSLTIEAGVTVKFCTISSDLIVTGTGSLTANGTSTNIITFTRDYPSINSWGHISFQSMGSASPSTLIYCIIEYGRKDGVINSLESVGGGLQTDFNSLTISKCTFRYNYAFFGGGIFVNLNRSPTIDSCLFLANTSREAGGAIYLYNGSSSVITNCIFDSNNANGTLATYYSGGAIQFGQSITNAKAINCTFVNNTSAHPGSAIYYLSGGSVVNSIFWGSSNQLEFNSSSGTVDHSAIQGYIPGSHYTNCFEINSSNTGTIPLPGPYFMATDGSNWSIQFVSPCRDAGTTPSPAVPYDIIGKPRVGPYDIGAYEVQYDHNSWTGATSSDWADATNWNPNIVPSATSHVLIPPSTHDPSIGLSDVTINDMVIESGSSLTIANPHTFTAATVINSGTLTISAFAKIVVTSLLNENIFTVNQTAQATVTTLTNNGTINLNSDVIDMFSLMFDTYSGTGTANIAMFLSGGGGTNNWKWHYVAVPAGYRNNKTMFTSINQYNLIQYDDSQIPDNTIATDNDGWVYHNGYMPGDLLGGPYSGPGFTDLYIGKGYGFYHSNESGATVNFTGLSSLVTSLGSLTLQYNGDGKLVPGNYGFNLMGNSLTCGIDWNLVTSTGNVNNVIYYTINYKIGSYVRGAPAGINGASQHIPPLQGFLVKTNELGTSLNFSSAREHTSQPRYKKSLELKSSDSKGSGSVDPMIKLELNNSGNQDETLIWFNQNATNSFDASYDGLKILSSGYDQIYSLSGSQKYGINAMQLPMETKTIPIAVKFLNSGSNFKIIASQLQGLENYNVTLTDKGNSNFITDLKNTGSYTFSSNAGTFPDRFVITIGTIATGVPDVIIPDKVFNVFAFDKTLNIEVLNDAWEGKKGTINLYNLTGIRVLQQNNIEWYKGDIKKIPLNLPQGIYIVEIKAENQKFVTKISIIK